MVVVGNRMLRKNVERTNDQGTGCCRRVHNENPCDSYCSPNTRRAIRSIGVDGWACGKHEGEGLASFLFGSLNLRDHLEGIGVVGWIILKRILEAVISWTALV